MNDRKEIIAMLLAGGQGSRLSPLTGRLAKPALPFAGHYRLIDFPLSACAHAGIDTVGLLTQYRPQALTDYIGSGAAWDLCRLRGGISILPPYQRTGRSDWYRGTADAVYQNLAFIGRYDPENVLILSGDHISQVDYTAMLAVHRRARADCTIGAVRVAPEDCSRFGILETDAEGRIRRFEEKPERPRGNLASMGVYIFRREVLCQALEEDAADTASAHDFGRNVIPRLLLGGARLFAYPFGGYFRDVGTLSALFSANMDLLGEHPLLRLDRPDFPLYAPACAYPPVYTGERAVVGNACLSAGCRIFGRVENAVLSPGVTVEEGAFVHDAVLFENVTVRHGAQVGHCIVDAGADVRCSFVCSRGRISALTAAMADEMAAVGEEAVS